MDTRSGIYRPTLFDNQVPVNLNILCAINSANLLPPVQTL